MNRVTLITPRLRLVNQSTAEVLAQVEALSAEHRAEVSPAWLERIRASNRPEPWTHGFSIVEAATGDVVGACGYKGPPDADGVAEIAYAVNPDRRMRGYATEAALALVEYALRSEDVRVVRAHTLPDNVASARVLEKCGFQRVGEVDDPEDGLVNRWDLEALQQPRP